MADTATPAKLTAEIGRSGLKHSAGIIFEEFDQQLRSKRAIATYDEMRRTDPTIAVGLRAISWILGQVEWHVEPGGESAADKEAAEFLDTCRTDMAITWSKFMRDALTCLPFGFAYLEWVLKQRTGSEAKVPSRYDDGRIGWKSINLIGHDSLEGWMFDKLDGHLLGFLQQGFILGSPMRPDTLIPIEKSILFRIDDEKDNPEGISLLRSVYLPWYMKRNIQEIEAIGIERDLTGVLIIHLPVSATQTDANKAIDLLEQYKADDMAGFTAPQYGPGDHEKWRFEVIASPGNKTVDSDKAIQRYKVEIATNFLAQFLMLGQGGNGGSFALGKDTRDLFETALGAIMMNFEETINRFLVPPLFRVNDFGKLTALPQLKAGRVGKSALDKFAAALSQLAAGGLLTPDRELEGHIRSEMELPEMLDPEEYDTTPEEDTGQEEDKVEKVDEKQATEPDEEDDFELPDPEDEEAWTAIEEDSNKRLKKAGFASLAEAFRFARPYNYGAKIDEYASQMRDDLSRLAEQLRNRSITPARWARESQVLLARYSVDGYRLGVAEATKVAPSKVKLTTEQRKMALEGTREQLDYFAKFRDDVKGKLAAGEELTTAVDARANLYSGTVGSSSNRAKLDTLDQQPLKWVRHKNDSCETCIGNEGKVKTAKEWRKGGVWPKHGTICVSNCGCALSKE